MQETIRIADGALEERLGHKFLTRELLARALTHSSAVPELRAAGTEETVSALFPGNNERLEFLGDAVLELLASEYLLASFPEWSEGQLSKSRARIVNAVSLEAAARRLRLGEHLRVGRGEEKTGGRCCLSRRWRSAVSASRSPIANRHCRSSCNDAGGHQRNIAWLEKAVPTTRRSSRSKFGLTGSAWQQAKAAPRRRRSNVGHEALWNNSNARKRKAEAECRKRS